MADLAKAQKLSPEQAEQVHQSRAVVSRGSKLQPWIALLQDFQVGEMGAIPLDANDSPTIVQRRLTTAGSRSEPQKSLTYDVRHVQDPGNPEQTTRMLYFEVTAYQPKLRAPRTDEPRRRGRPPKTAGTESGEQTLPPEADAQETAELLVAEAILGDPPQEDGEQSRRRR